MKINYLFAICLMLVIIGCGTTIKHVPLNEHDQKLYDEIKYIATDEQLNEFLSLTSTEARERLIKRFWKEKDPTPATELNERKEEHIRRVKYANTNFSRPSLNLQGWRTDKGRIYIKYGEPDEIIKRELRDPMVSWYYDESWIYNELNLEYFFSDLDQLVYPDTQHYWYSTYMSMLVNAPVDYFRLEQEELICSFDYARFKTEDGHTRIEAYYELPLNQFIDEDDNNTEKEITIEVEKVAVIFDIESEEVVRTQELIESTIVLLDNTEIEPQFIREISQLVVPPGEYLLAVALTELNTTRTKHDKFEIIAPDYDTLDLSLSDLQFACSIIPTDSVTKFYKNNYNIIPFPSHAYQRTQKLMLYYEIYGLIPNQHIQTHYEVEYQIKGHNLLAHPLVFEDKQTSDTTGVFVTKTFTLKRLPYDTYDITILVKDKVSGAECTITNTFQVVGWSIY